MARILIIEDEPAILTLLRRILAGAGHEILTATDGGSACSAAEENEIDLVLSDLSIPGPPTGMGLIHQIRKARPDCPLVVVSGYSSDDTVSECRDIGVTDFLPKPFDLAFVRGFVDEILGRSNAVLPVRS